MNFVAKSRDVEVLEGKSQYLEFAGNLIPVTKSGDQLAFNFYAFRENRLPFTVRVKDQNAESCGRVAFMRQPKLLSWRRLSFFTGLFQPLIKSESLQVGRGEAPQSPICTLNLSLPDNIQPEPAPSEPDLLALEKNKYFELISETLPQLQISQRSRNHSYKKVLVVEMFIKNKVLWKKLGKAETIHKADLRLSDISNMLASDWVALAKELEISDSDINIIKTQYPDNTPQQAIVMLRLWMQTSGNKVKPNKRYISYCILNARFSFYKYRQLETLYKKPFEQYTGTTL
ncbi:hypothetical protein Anas_01326 [Armadillidium nasatum]|uniref:Death domain-containing protein n=1 Tax=Armadillidium nasatum TaxID=96803 RepID=A0A5N5SKC0_9CRUS|nr:hypothetical protein Anas_01326 [Armadillidium nasatum]